MRSPMSSCAGMRAMCSASPRRHPLPTMRCSGLAAASNCNSTSVARLSETVKRAQTTIPLLFHRALFVDVSGAALISGHVENVLAPLQGAPVLDKEHSLPDAENHAAFG